MSNYYGNMFKIFSIINFFILASSALTCNSCYQKTANVSSRVHSKKFEKMAITQLSRYGKNSRHFCYNKTDLGEPEVCADRGICMEWNIALDFGKQRQKKLIHGISKYCSVLGSVRFGLVWFG